MGLFLWFEVLINGSSVCDSGVLNKEQNCKFGKIVGPIQLFIHNVEKSYKYFV